MKARKYEFYIIDRQYDDEYDYIAYFEDDFDKQMQAKSIIVSSEYTVSR